MKRSLSVVAAVVGLALAGGVAFAQMGPGWGGGQGQGSWPMGGAYGQSGYGPGPCGPMTGMMGPGMMGPGMMGPGMMGPGMMGPGMMGQGTQTPPVVDIDKAKEAAQQYVNQYLKGYAIDMVLPFTGGMGLTMYSVEIKGPNGEGRVLHVNPWGAVMPMGGPWQRTG